MPANILITGAAGYMGGTLVANILARRTAPLDKASIFAAARTEEQVRHLTSKLHGINVVQLDVSDGEAVDKVILDKKIGLVVHTASSSDGSMVHNIIQSLGRLRKAEKITPHLVHSSLTTSYTAEAGWPYGELNDKENIYQLEKKLNTSHAVIATNQMVVDECNKQGVTVSIVVVPVVYGPGSGEWRKVSILIPLYIRAAIARGVMNKPEDDNAPQAAHVDDLMALYRILIERILVGKAVPTGEEGYILCIAHKIPWWKTLDAMAEKMYQRGLVKQARAEVFSYDEAAEVLGLPKQYVRAMIACGGDLVGTKASELGWKPHWDGAKMLAHLDEEIQAVVDHGHVTSGLFSKLLKSEENQARAAE